MTVFELAQKYNYITFIYSKEVLSFQDYRMYVCAIYRHLTVDEISPERLFCVEITF